MRMERREIGFQIKTVSNLMLRKLDSERPPEDERGLTRMQAWIIVYIYNCGDKDVFQRDVEAEFNIRRSTVTGILQLMEQNGLITRSRVPYDARLKKLTLTKKAMEILGMMRDRMTQMEELINRGISEEEREVFFGVIEKIKANLA